MINWNTVTDDKLEHCHWW